MIDDDDDNNDHRRVANIDGGRCDDGYYLFIQYITSI